MENMGLEDLKTKLSSEELKPHLTDLFPIDHPK